MILKLKQFEVVGKQNMPPPQPGVPRVVRSNSKNHGLRATDLRNNTTTAVTGAMLSRYSPQEARLSSPPLLHDDQPVGQHSATEAQRQQHRLQQFVGSRDVEDPEGPNYEFYGAHNPYLSSPSLNGSVGSQDSHFHHPTLRSLYPQLDDDFHDFAESDSYASHFRWIASNAEGRPSLRNGGVYLNSLTLWELTLSQHNRGLTFNELRDIDSRVRLGVTDDFFDTLQMKSVTATEKPHHHADPQGWNAGDDEHDVCCICLEKFDAQTDYEPGSSSKGGVINSIVALPRCSHVFHSRCLRSWFGDHATCPLCRSDVRES